MAFFLSSFPFNLFNLFHAFNSHRKGITPTNTSTNNEIKVVDGVGRMEKEENPTNPEVEEAELD